MERALETTRRGVSPSPACPHRRGCGTLATLILTVALAGCSLPVTSRSELVVGYVGVTERCGCVRRVIPGLDLSVNTPWPGLRLGWSDVVVVLPAPETVAPPLVPDSSDGYRAPLGWQWTDDKGVRHALGWFMSTAPLGDPSTFFICHDTIGLSFRWAEVSQGASLGLTRTTILTTPADGDKAFALAFDSDRPCATRFLPLAGGPFDAE